MAEPVPDDVIFLIGQAELLFRRAGFDTKRETVVHLKDSVEVADLIATSRGGESVVVECKPVEAETFELVKPLLEDLKKKRVRLEEGRALLLTKPKRALGGGEFRLDPNPAEYMKEQVYFWNYDEFMRLYSLKGEDLISWVHRRLSLPYQSKEAKKKEVKEKKEEKEKLSDLLSLEGANLASAASTKDALLPAGMGSVQRQQQRDSEGFFSSVSSEEMMRWLIAGVIVSAVVLYFTWETIESFFSSLEASLCGLAFIGGFLLLIGFAEKL